MAGAHVVTEQLREAVAQSRIRRTNSMEPMGNITISAGLASYHRGESATRFIEHADAALHISKTQGKNCVTLAM